MRRSILFLLPCAILLAAAAVASAQETRFVVGDPQAAKAAAEMKQVEAQRVVQAVQQGLDKFNIEFKVASSGMLGPVVTNAPYSATTTNETIQTLADGNRIVQRSTYNVARDAQGRVRREEINEAGAVVSIMIMDPVANTSYVLDPASRTVRKSALLRNFVRTESNTFLTEGTVDRSGTVTVRGVPSAAAKGDAAAVAEVKARTAQTFVYGDSASVMVSPAARTKMDFRREPLGTQDLEGVAADGTRTVFTIPAGQIGNERPIDIVSEQWYSKDLQMAIMSRYSDPRTGETNYHVSNIRRAEPDPSLFQVPGDYTMTESSSGAVTKIVK